MKERLKNIFGSLRFRVLIILLLVGLVPINLIKNGILENNETQSVSQRASMIRSQCGMIGRELAAFDYLDGEPSDVIESELKQMGNLYRGRVIVVNKYFRIIRDTYGIDDDKTVVARELINCFQGNDSDYYVGSDDFIEVVSPIIDDATREIIGAFILSVPTSDIIEGKEALSRTVLILQIVMTLIIIAAAFYASSILVRPFNKVTEYLNAGEDISGEELSMPYYTETKMLADAYNQMQHRLRAQEESRQEFVSNVSHELKTPMTSMKVLSDSLIQQAQFGEVPNEMYADFMKDISEEIDRENKIITDLLELVKMDRTSADIHIEETNINDLIGLILKRLRPIAARKGVEIALESYKPIIAEVDRTKLTLAISNLVENGIKYNKEKGWVHVSLNMDNTYFFIKVEDSGIGIPQQDQEYIFERFFRVDKSHSREIGGTGLGLAITKSSVLMHNGAIRVYSREGEGTTFIVRIPLHYTRHGDRQKREFPEEI